MKRKNQAPIPVIDEAGKKVHPLVHLARTVPLKDIAKLLGHKNHSTVSIYLKRMKQRPTTPIPAEWCLPLAEKYGLTPGQLRPDLYRPDWR